MTRTSRVGLLFMLVACGGGSTVQSPALAPATAEAPAPAAPVFEPLALLPTRSFAVGQVDLVRLRQSAVWSRLLELAEGLEQNGGLSVRERERIAGFLNVAKVARSLVFGMAEHPTGRDPRMVVVVEGMPVAELPQFVRTMGDGTVQEAAGGHRSGPAAGMVLEGRWVLGSAEELPAIPSRRAEGVTPFAGSPSLAEAAPGARFGQSAVSLAIDSTSPFVKREVMQDVLLGLDQGAIDDTDSAALWVDTATGVEASLELRTTTPEAARTLATTAQSQLSSLRSELLLIPFGVRDLVDATEVATVDKTASIRFVASEDLAMRLLERLEGFLSLTLDGSLARAPDDSERAP